MKNWDIHPVLFIRIHTATSFRARYRTPDAILTTERRWRCTIWPPCTIPSCPATCWRSRWSLSRAGPEEAPADRNALEYRRPPERGAAADAGGIRAGRYGRQARPLAFRCAPHPEAAHRCQPYAPSRAAVPGGAGLRTAQAQWFSGIRT